MSRLARRASPAFDRDVDAVAGGHPRKALAQCGVGRDVVASTDADHQFQSGERIVGHPADRVDVAALPGEFGCHRGERARGHRAAEQHHGVCRGLMATGLSTNLDVDIHPDRAHRLLDDVLHLLGVGVARDEHPECQAIMDDDLLDVEQGNLLSGKRTHEHRGDTGLVGAGDGDQEGRLHDRTRSGVNRSGCGSGV